MTTTLTEDLVLTCDCGTEYVIGNPFDHDADLGVCITCAESQELRLTAAQFGVILGAAS